MVIKDNGVHLHNLVSPTLLFYNILSAPIVPRLTLRYCMYNVHNYLTVHDWLPPDSCRIPLSMGDSIF